MRSEIHVAVMRGYGALAWELGELGGDDVRLGKAVLRGLVVGMGVGKGWEV